jgi:YlmC/YmxH family sporulation protein
MDVQARASEIRMLDVINIIDGRKLGNVIDLDLDVHSGEVKAILVPGEKGWLYWFKRSRDVEIPWNRIVKIGVDVILVELPEMAINVKQEGY